MATPDGPFNGFELPSTAQLLPGPTNFIRNIIFHPCSRPWFIYILTALPALVKAIITVRYIDPSDIMREEAKAFVEGAHYRTGRGGKHSIRGLLEDEKLARKTWSQKAVGTLIAATEPLEYLGFAALLYFAADRFWYDWQALLLAWNYCEGDPDSGPFQMRREAPSFFIGSYQMDRLLQNRSSWSHNTVGVDVPPGLIFAALSLNASYNGLGTAHVNLVLQTSGAVTLGDVRSETLELTAGQSGDMVVAHEWFFPFGGTVSWNVEGDPVPTGYPSSGGQVTVIKQQVSEL